MTFPCTAHVLCAASERTSGCSGGEDNRDDDESPPVVLLTMARGSGGGGGVWCGGACSLLLRMPVTKCSKGGTLSVKMMFLL
jgi:hypothetical protein